MSIPLSSINMSTSFKLSSLFFTTTLLFMFSLTDEANSEVSFSADLIHRDSPLSPFYNSSQTHSDRLHNAFLRSISRARYFSRRRRSTSLQSQGSQDSLGEFLIKISIGTPPKTIVGLADTGSDLIWTQCKPCEECFKQVHPIFDPRKSSTYRDLPCASGPCKELPSTCSRTNSCKYSYSYGDNSTTFGNLASETVTMLSTRGRPVSLPGFTIGCGHKNEGLYDEAGSGVFGLGHSPLSLVSQLGAHNISKQFSYCLLPPSSNATSKIIFGGASVRSGPGTVSTPLILDAYYTLTLEAISVGNKKLAYAGSSAKGGGRIPKKGNIILDSGTTVIYLDPEFYKKLEKVVAGELGGTRVRAPSDSVYSYCFKGESVVVDPPVIKAHFTGAEVELKTEYIFAEAKEGVICFSVVPEEQAIFGYVGQWNLIVAYDLVKKTVSFTPTECAKH